MAGPITGRKLSGVSHLSLQHVPSLLRCVQLDGYALLEASDSDVKQQLSLHGPSLRALLVLRLTTTRFIAQTARQAPPSCLLPGIRDCMSH